MAYKSSFIQQYQPCGCSVETRRKRDLLGYCSEHGSDAKVTMRILTRKEARQGRDLKPVRRKR